MWEKDQQNAFEQLKDALMSDHVLAYPNLNKPYKLYTDANDYCIGAVLCQEYSDGNERVIQYLSYQLASTRQTWPTIVKESFAIVYTIDRLRAYLQGAKLSVYTDHHPLTSLFTCQIKNTKLVHWQVFLAEFDADITYIQGFKNNVADVLFRQVEPLPCVPPMQLPIDMLDTVQFMTIGRQLVCSGLATYIGANQGMMYT